MKGSWMPQAVAHEWVVLDKPGVELHNLLLTFRAYMAVDGDAAYESRCDELDGASCGHTVSEALANAVEATLLYLNTLEEVGERRRVFDEHGIDFDRGVPPARGGGTPRRTAKKVAVGPGETVQRHTLALT